MNLLHRWYCRSSRWRTKLENEVLPWTLGGVDLGRAVLEIGPGPGLTTEWLRRHIDELTLIEIDAGAAASLERKLAGPHLRVDRGDATAMPYPSGSFSGAVAFTMLHHVPSRTLQDRLFAEVYRVLQPGGTFAGVDILPSVAMRLSHIRDTMVLVDPASLPARLAAAGFREIRQQTRDGRFRFSALRPLDTTPSASS